MHQFPFQFALPQSSLPCSLESKLGTIRYYIKVSKINISIVHHLILQLLYDHYTKLEEDYPKVVIHFQV